APGDIVAPIERYLATLEHEELLVRRGTRSGLFTMVAVHSTVRGRALGGCRMWRYDDSRSAVRDALRLSRAMTYKSAVADLPRGGSGDPSPFTALGVEAAILATCERAFGSTSLVGRSVALIGLGHVGLRLARLLSRRKAKLIVADIDPAKRGEAERLGARWTT